ARWVRVHPQLVESAELLRALPLGHVFDRDQDVVLLGYDQVTRTGRPLAAGILRGLGADVGPLLKTLVRPDMDELVEGTDLSVPEAIRGRVLLADGIGFGEMGLVFGDLTRPQVVGPDLINHSFFSQCRRRTRA